MLRSPKKNAGWLQVEECVRSMQGMARKLGAVLRDEEQVISWNSTSERVEVVTNKNHYQGNRLIITAGPLDWQGSGRPWTTTDCDEATATLVHPASRHGFTIRRPTFPDLHHRYAERPFLWHSPSQAGPGVKIAQHYGAPELKLPDEVDRKFCDQESSPHSTVFERVSSHTFSFPPVIKCCLYLHAFTRSAFYYRPTSTFQKSSACLWFLRPWFQIRACYRRDACRFIRRQNP